MTGFYTDEQYQELKVRVARGKEILDGKWGSWNSETREWIDLWYTLTNQLTEEENRRAGEKPERLVSNGALPGETADDYVERKRAELIQKGVFRGQWAKTWLRAYVKRKGGIVKNDQSQVKSNSLFESSIF